MSADVQVIRVGLSSRLEVREVGEHPKLLFVVDLEADGIEVRRRGRAFFLSFARLRDEIDREYPVGYVEPRT